MHGGSNRNILLQFVWDISIISSNYHRHLFIFSKFQSNTWIKTNRKISFRRARSKELNKNMKISFLRVYENYGHGNFQFLTHPHKLSDKHGCEWIFWVPIHRVLELCVSFLFILSQMLSIIYLNTFTINTKNIHKKKRFKFLNELELRGLLIVHDVALNLYFEQWD